MKLARFLPPLLPCPPCCAASVLFTGGLEAPGDGERTFDLTAQPARVTA